MIFVDTSFWAAQLNRRDDRHPTAVDLLTRCADRPLITSNHVRGETWTLLRRRAGHRIALRFVDALARSARVELVHLSEDVESDALSWLRGHDEREYSFVDATSFALMRARRIFEALAFDGDFTAAGFVELRPA